MDEGFSGGMVSSGFVAEAAVALDDGKLLVAGRQGNLDDGSSRAVVQRLNADGTVDAAFGNGGRVVGTDANAAAYAIALGPDGTFYTAGTRDGHFAVTRYKANGAADPKFGVGGGATADFGGNDVAYALAVTPDGSVVAGGASAATSSAGATSAFAFARFHSDGSADEFFGSKGISLFGLGSGNNVVGSLALDRDGRIVAAGAAGGNVAVVRLDVAGNEDASFGTLGAFIIPQLATRGDLDGPDRTIGITLQDDGLILVNNRTARGDFGVTRVNANGTLDTSFATNGTVSTDFGGDDDADAVLVQGSGEILAVGTTDAGGKAQFAVAAFGRDGTLDESFGTGGKFTVDASAVDKSRALHVADLVLRAFANLQPNGQLVVGAANQSRVADTSSGLRRLNVPGSGLLGKFGGVSGSRPAKLTFADGDNTTVTISLKGGTGQAFFNDGGVDLVLTGTSAASVLSIKTKGGDGAVTLRNVQADGALKTFAGKSADLSGVFNVGGDLGNVALRTVAGTLAAAGSIKSVALAGDLGEGAMILAGSQFGSDRKVGGAGPAADGFAGARLGKLTVKGNAGRAFVGAGVNPVNGAFNDGDDRVEGGAGSAIGSILVRGDVDAAARFVAGAVGKAKLPGLVDPATDPRFQIIA